MTVTKKRKADPGAKTAEIHLLDNFTEIPAPDYPLLKVGKKTYDLWCRTLIQSGNLTIKTREYVELLAVSKDDVAQAKKTGKRPTRQALEGIRAALMKLEKLDADTAITTPQGGESIYAAFGFAKSARASRHN